MERETLLDIWIVEKVKKKEETHLDVSSFVENQ